jgi:aarF domain-containing kinase
MLLIDNIMHADLHPGNIMIDILNSGDRHAGSSKFRFALVDAGMVTQLTQDEGQQFIGLLTALGEGDGRAAAEFALRFSIENNIKEEDKEKFKDAMCKLFEKVCKGYGSNVDVGDVLRGVLGLIRDHHVRIDANYATLVINLLCLESLARRVCPSYNVLDASQPLLQTYRKLCFHDDGFTPKSKDSDHKV